MSDPNTRVEQMPHALYYVEEAFGAGGWLSKLPGFQPREGQFELADRIASSFLAGRHLVSEGPTGTGKSMAYLIPAAYHAANTGDRVLVVTANITLQEQIARKDLPTLQNILPWKFTYTLLKGKSNYLCPRARDTFEVESRKHLRMYKPEDAEAINRVLQWSHTTKSGDKSELPGAVPDRIWSLFSVTPEDCLGNACSQHDTCPSILSRREVNVADIVVTNYHMLLSDLLYSFLPDYRYVVLDEAHRLSDIARDFFGFEIHEGMVRYAIKNLDPSSEHRKAVENASPAFFREVVEFYNSGQYSVRLRDAPAFHHTGPLVLSLRKAAEHTRSIARYIEESQPNSREIVKEHSNRAVRLSLLASRIEEFSILPKPERVYYLEQDSKMRVRLMAKQVDVAHDLHEKLFSKCTTILTSATLSVHGKFSHLLKDVGLPDTTHVFETASPFNWEKQAVLVVPEHFTPPADRTFKNAVGKALVDIVTMARGRTLALFTSRTGMDVAYEHLVNAVLPYKILKQDQGQRSELVEEFKRNTSSVLLGLASFWEGVDIPGESLSCVVMDKLPFPLKDDPILDALEAQGQDTFYSYSIPRAVIAFKQGFGRLIRTSSDTGVVVLLDNRIHTKWKNYGYKFLESLPPGIHRSPDLNDIRKILE